MRRESDDEREKNYKIIRKIDFYLIKCGIFQQKINNMLFEQLNIKNSGILTTLKHWLLFIKIRILIWTPGIITSIK